MRRLLLLVFLACLPLATGCATVIHGTTQEVPVNSDPAGATVTVAGQPNEYATPCSIELKRKNDHLLTVSKEGYETQNVELRSVISAAWAGNIIAGGIIGLGVDAATGASCCLIPEMVTVKLRPVEQPAAKDEPPQWPDIAAQMERLGALREEDTISEREYQAIRRTLVPEKCDRDRLMNELIYANHLCEIGIITAEERQLMRDRTITEWEG